MNFRTSDTHSPRLGGAGCVSKYDSAEKFDMLPEALLGSDICEILLT